MTWAVIFSLGLVVIVVVGFVITRRQRDNAWKQLAADLGAEFIAGGALHSSKLQARVQQRTVTLDSYSIASGDSNTTYTRLRSTVENKDGLQFVVFREGLIARLHKALGSQDIQVGVEDFDHDFVIQGNNATRLRALLSDVKLRELIQGQRSGKLGLKGNELLFEAQGVIKDVPRPKSMFELFTEQLNRLERRSTGGHPIQERRSPNRQPTGSRPCSHTGRS